MAMALTLLSQAANGITYEKLRKGLYLNSDKAVVADQFHDVFKLIEKSAGQSKLIIANQVFLQQEYQLNKDFQEIAVNKFNSGVQSVNFRESNKTKQFINSFVAEKTNGKVKEFATKLTFDKYTRLFLVNSIYLKSMWEQPFPLRSSKRVFNESVYNEKFYIGETKTIDVQYMSMTKCFWHATMDELDAAALRLDYASSNFSFIIILPNTRTGLPMLESQLHDVILSKFIDQMSFSECHIKIPKFKVESKFSMNDILRKVY